MPPGGEEGQVRVEDALEVLTELGHEGYTNRSELRAWRHDRRGRHDGEELDGDSLVKGAGGLWVHSEATSLRALDAAGDMEIQDTLDDTDTGSDSAPEGQCGEGCIQDGCDR